MLTEGAQRRMKIIELLSKRTTPVSGTDLAKQFGVSRQVIVQDVALLRAENRDILSTNKGYLLFKPHSDDHSLKEVLLVKHTEAQILDEMSSIRSDIVINNAEDARDFVQKMQESTSKPLCVLTDDYHYHTISAPSAKSMELIKADLREKGYLIE